MSDKRISPESICKGKTRFPSIGKAREAVKLTIKIHKGRKPRPYVCPNCHGYHLASTE